MKDKIIAKLDEHIQRILDKPEITGEEYMTLRCRLGDLCMEEERALVDQQTSEHQKRMTDMMRAVMAAAEVDHNGM